MCLEKQYAPEREAHISPHPNIGEIGTLLTTDDISQLLSQLVIIPCDINPF